MPDARRRGAGWACGPIVLGDFSGGLATHALSAIFTHKIPARAGDETLRRALSLESAIATPVRSPAVARPAAAAADAACAAAVSATLLPATAAATRTPTPRLHSS